MPVGYQRFIRPIWTSTSFFRLEKKSLLPAATTKGQLFISLTASSNSYSCPSTSPQCITRDTGFVSSAPCKNSPPVCVYRLRSVPSSVFLQTHTQFLPHCPQSLPPVADTVLILRRQLRRCAVKFRQVEDRVIAETVLSLLFIPDLPSIAPSVVSTLPSGQTAATAQINLALLSLPETPSRRRIRSAFFTR